MGSGLGLALCAGPSLTLTPTLTTCAAGGNIEKPSKEEIRSAVPHSIANMRSSRGLGRGRVGVGVGAGARVRVRARVGFRVGCAAAAALVLKNHSPISPHISPIYPLYLVLRNHISRDWPTPYMVRVRVRAWVRVGVS